MVFGGMDMFNRRWFNEKVNVFLIPVVGVGGDEGFGVWFNEVNICDTEWALVQCSEIFHTHIDYTMNAAVARIGEMEVCYQ